ncbi:MAG TPA: RNase adapter RapZ [bacterium]|nr:RNase adapter RapZ [bacterium]
MTTADNNPSSRRKKKDRMQTDDSILPLITITSFGFHVSGIPDDPTGHGGGFIFDCRGLPNPGRDPRYAKQSGLDKPVAEFLRAVPEVDQFIDHAFALIVLTASSFQQRRFPHLSVGFGCTGGQHRSVYCAERTAEKLRNAGFRVKLIHQDKPTFL